MISLKFIPFLFATNFKGVNCKDSYENVDNGEWEESSLNILSDPAGSLSSRPGFTSLTTASIGSATAFIGFYEFVKHSGGSTTRYYINGGSNGKLYQYESNAYTEILSGLSVDADDRLSFFTLDNTVIVCADGNLPVAWTGSGTPATWGTSVTADWGLEAWNYPWLHSTVDPRLLYYGTLSNPDSSYVKFLNFDEDGEGLTGACRAGDDMLVGKINGLYKIQYRGQEPLFDKTRLASKVGPVSFWAMKELPDGRAVFLAKDCNFYMVVGDAVTPCGDNIQAYIQKGVKAKLSLAVMGLLLSRSQLWCSFTRISGSTKNDRTVVMDYSRPYADKWGKIQYPWFIYSIGANCFAEANISGDTRLYHGGYTGKMYRDDTGTNDDGAAFNSTYRSHLRGFGDSSLDKKFDYLNMALESKGDWDLGVQMIFDGNAATEKNVNQNLLQGLGKQSLFDVAKFDEDYFSGESDIDVTRDIDRQGKVMQIAFGTTGLDQAWRMYNYKIHARGLRRRNVTKEAS